MGLRKTLKNLIINLLPKTIIREIERPIKLHYINLLKYSTISYSQEGEDMILQRWFNSKKNGFYIDVGAHHPRRFSNTYLLYKQGWRGINIDPRPDISELFLKERPDDIFINVGISDENETLTYFIFNEPALNTFSKQEAELRNGRNGYFIKEERKTKVVRLEDVLNEYLPEGQHIDFISIDVEGLDLKVLNSNNWKKYRPTYILCESKKRSNSSYIDEDLNQFLSNIKYTFMAKTINTYFYIDYRKH